MKSAANSFLAAIQFMTRVPVHTGTDFAQDTLARSAVFFPVVGLLVGVGGAVLNWALSLYVPRSVVVTLVLAYLVIITGALHEDGLADAADGFGGGWHKEQILEIMRDSRIGSFGAVAIMLSFIARFVFLQNIPLQRFAAYLIVGQVLSRWTALPLAYFLPAARGQEGLGPLVAKRISGVSLIVGTTVMLAIVGVIVRRASGWVLLTAMVTAIATALYYRSRIGGITGDCLGATNQITELAVYLTGVILR